MKTHVTKKSTKDSQDTVLLVWKSATIFLVVCIAWYWIPRLLSSDPCFNDWDIECTYAPGILRTMDWTGLLVVFLGAYIFAPLFMVTSAVLLLRQLKTKSSK